MSSPSSELAPRQSTCPACGHHVAVPFLDAERQPLATLAWPRSRPEAEGLTRLPLEFVRCVRCGHVYNSRFDYAQVPYSEKPNLMFNKGAVWSEHLAWVCAILLEQLPEAPTVVEIGCGEGHLLRAMARKRPAGRYVGFDPNARVETAGCFTARAELFDPAVHLAECRPDLLISRHVLEHLVNPLGFLQLLTFAASYTRTPARLYIEVPCIDRVFETGRTVDFYYEHNSHFTTGSFTRMLEHCAPDVDWVKHSYNGEVICGLVRLGIEEQVLAFARQSAGFQSSARAAVATIRAQLEELRRAGRRIAVWGGTGKAAAFLNHYGLDADRFPLVVDSDPDKTGTFVPGTGQEIRFRDHLLTHPADMILIPMQWRARDVLHEMGKAGIPEVPILIEHQGRLVDFFQEEHPY